MTVKIWTHMLDCLLHFLALPGHPAAGAWSMVSMHRPGRLARRPMLDATCNISCTRLTASQPAHTWRICSAGMCYLGCAVSGREPTVVKVHAAGHDPLDRVKHKEFFAQEALKLVLRCI